MVRTILFYCLILCVCWAKQDSLRQCDPKQTCHECIETAGCAWCSQEDILDSPRCFRPDMNLPYISDVCSEEYVYFPVGSIEVDEKKLPKVKKLLPERYNLNLRIGDPVYLSIRINRNLDDLKNLSSLELHHNASKYIAVHFKCLNNASASISNCDVVEGIQYVNIKIKALKCSKHEENWKQNFIVYSTDADDAVVINAELLCSCPCEKKGSAGYVSKSKQCNSVGTLKCGVCHCDSYHSGKNCECIRSKSSFGCKPPKGNDSTVCSGKGICLCDACICNVEMSRKYSGRWCECDDFSCLYHNGRMCSGNGVCDCGKCLCRPSWSGEACECSNSINGCYDTLQGNKTICNGQGDCVCGKCQCHNKGGRKYNGKYCEECVNCENHCGELKSCVLCKAYKKGPYGEEDCSTKCNQSTVFIEAVEENLDSGEFLCEGEYKTCKYKFLYKQTNGTFVIKTMEELQC